MDWRMQRKRLHTAFSQWKRRVQKSSVNIHLLVTKTCAIQDLSPRIIKALQIKQRLVWTIWMIFIYGR
jgi:hypothetical protein